mgnify:CR=1 FL=1
MWRLILISLAFGSASSFAPSADCSNLSFSSRCHPTGDDSLLTTRAVAGLQSSERHSTNLFYRDHDDQLEAEIQGLNDADNKVKEKVTDFRSRMRSIVVKQQRSPSSRQSSSLQVESLEEYADVISQGRTENKVVVVRFTATWCKTCHFLRPAFNRLASSNSQVIFVDVPVLDRNANLHQGLGVDSVPFGHIYHPQNGLVEECKLSRKSFSEFEGLVKTYANEKTS